jgi:hypothetical protein
MNDQPEEEERAEVEQATLLNSHFRESKHRLFEKIVLVLTRREGRPA